MLFASHEGLGKRNSRFPDTNSRTKRKWLQCSLVVATEFDRRVRKPTLWGECVGRSKVGVTAICGPLMNANRCLEKSEMKTDDRRIQPTFLGTNCPSMTAPPGPVFRGNVAGTAG